MPDTVGFALGTAFLAVVLTIFGIIDRIVCGVATEIRYSIGPGLSAGLRAWGRDVRAVDAEGVAEPDEADRPGAAPPTGRSPVATSRGSWFPWQPSRTGDGTCSRGS